MLSLLQGRDTGQIGARRYRREILLQTFRCKTRQHVAILDLDGRFVFKMYKHQVKDLRARRNMQCFGTLSACGLQGLAKHRTRMCVTPTGNFVRDVVHFQQV